MTLGATALRQQDAVVELRESFDVFLPASAVWERLRLPGAPASDTCRIPGFPSSDGSPGCVVGVESDEPQQRLAGTKLDEPCGGTVIRIEIGPANASGWPTRVSMVQAGFAPPLADLPDYLNAHWRRIVADFRLYVEHGVTAPASTWGASLGATTRETPTGLVIAEVMAEGFADRCGMRVGDLLVTLADVRVLDTAGLWTVLAVFKPGDEVDACWVRDGEMMDAMQTLGGHG